MEPLLEINVGSSANDGNGDPLREAFTKTNDNFTSIVTANLKSWANTSAFTITSATRDSDGVITTATVSWPDGSTGTFTRTTKNATFLTIDAYTVTHAESGSVVTQAAVTRDSSGNVTTQPALTIT